MRKTGKSAVKCLQRFQISQQRAVSLTGIFTRHHQRNSGRIRNHTGGYGSSGHVVNFNFFNIIMHQIFISFHRAHIRVRQNGKTGRQSFGGAEFFHGFEHFVRKIFQPHFPIAFAV